MSDIEEVRFRMTLEGKMTTMMKKNFMRIFRKDLSRNLSSEVERKRKSKEHQDKDTRQEVAKKSEWVQKKEGQERFLRGRHQGREEQQWQRQSEKERSQ